MLKRILLIAGLLVLGTAAQNTAVFPAALPTAQTLPVACNNCESKLTSTITANSRSFTVLDPDKFPSVPFIVTIVGPSPDYANREIILVCQKQGNTFLTCPNGRGFDKSIPAYHKYGDTVAGLIVSHYINQLAAEVTAQAAALGANLANVVRIGQAAGGDLRGTFPNLTVNTVGNGKLIPSGDLVGTTDTQLLINKTVTGTFYGPLHGNADTATTAVSFAVKPAGCVAGKYSKDIGISGVLDCKAVDWSELINRPISMPPSGPATGDLTGFYPNPSVAQVGNRTALSIATTVDVVSLATDAAVSGTLVKRAANGNISAEIFTGSFLGNATTAGSLLIQPRNCDSGKFAIGIDRQANLTCDMVQVGQLSGIVTAAQLPDSGVVATSYGSGTQIPVFNVDRTGRVTSASTAAIDTQAYRQVQNSGTNLAKQSTLNFTSGLIATADTTSTKVGLATTGVTAGQYGSATKSTQFTVNAFGQITSIVEQTIPGTDGSGYVSVYNGSTLLPQRNFLQALNGITALDDSVNHYTVLQLSASGVTAGAYGNASSVPAFNVDVLGRIISVAATPIQISGAQITSGIIANSLLNATPLNNQNTLVLRDSGGNFTAGTITATSFVGALNGNANTATNIAWSGVTGKPTTISSFTNDAGFITSSVNSQMTINPGLFNTFALGLGNMASVGSLGATDHNGDIIFYAFGGSHGYLAYRPKAAIPNFYLTAGAGYDQTQVSLTVNGPVTATQFNGSLNGNAATASVATSANSVAWANITNKPANLVFNDGGMWGISVSGSAGSVNWTNVSSKPPNFVFNDGASYGINVTGNAATANSATNATAATTATKWVGTKQINFAYGDGVNPVQSPTGIMGVWRATAYTGTFNYSACYTDVGTATINLYGTDWVNPMATLTCSYTGGTATPNASGVIPMNGRVGFKVVSLTGSPTTIHVSMQYATTAY